MANDNPSVAIRPDSARSQTINWSTRLVRGQLFRMLSRLEHGYLVISDFEGVHCFGNAADPAELQVSIEVHNPSFYTAVAFRGSVGAGEAFMKGYEDTEREEEETKNEAYEQAFKTRRKKKRAEPEDPDRDAPGNRSSPHPWGALWPRHRDRC